MKIVPVFVFCFFFSWSAFTQKVVSVQTENLNQYFPTVEKGDTTMWFQDPCESIGIRVVLWCDTSMELYVFEKDGMGRIVRQDCVQYYQDDAAPKHRYLVYEAKGVDYTYTMEGLPVGYASDLSEERLAEVSNRVLRYFEKK